MLTLSPWQISVVAVMAVIAVLIGTLVVYARVLANRVGKAYAALRRIEEGLISASAPGGYASGLVASMAATESAGVSATHVPVPERDRRVSYLTVRDLKVMARSGRRRSDAEVSQEAAAQLSARLFSGAESGAASGDLRRRASQPGANQPGADEAGVDQAGASEAGAAAWASQAGPVQADADQVDAGPEPTGLSSSSAVLQELATATSEVRALLNESAEPAPEFASTEPSEAAAEPAPVHELATPTSSVEDQPAPQVGGETAQVNSHIAQVSSDTAQVSSDTAQVTSDTDAELAEKRRKRNAELILPAHHRRRRARGH